jgi:hypothetical protein
VSDERDPRVVQALREDAYRVPVTVTAGELRRRLESDRRRERTGWGWLGAIASAAAIAVVLLSASSISTRPPTSGATPTLGVACAETPAITHGGWWVEVGGPNAFFNIEPGTLTATDEGATWLIHVRFEPDAGSEELVSIAADLEPEGRRVDGRLNSPADPTNIFHLNSPAPALPGGWYLFELDIHEPGCWQLSASIDDRVVGTATVLVGPEVPAPSDSAPSGPAPTTAPATVAPTQAVGDVHVHFIGRAPECRSEGGCGYFLELAGEGRRDRVELDVAVEPFPAPGDPVTRYELYPDRAIDPLATGNYSVTLTSFRYSDVVISGAPRDAELTASCSTDFELDRGPASIVVIASFSQSNCTATMSYVVLAGQLQYELTCGPIEPTRCRERADDVVRAALLRNPELHVESLTFSTVAGDYVLQFTNGSGISVIID